jgi:hypothetical protein
VNHPSTDGTKKELQAQAAEPGSQLIQVASPAAETSKVDSGQSQPSAKPETKQKKDRSIELWNDAYDQLEVEPESATIANAYKETLAELLTDDEVNSRTGSGAAGTRIDRASRSVIKAKILDGLKDRSRRQELMARFVKEGQEKTKTWKTVDRVGRVADTILQAKPAVDVALHIPHAAPAALPWAGICVCLKVSLHGPRHEA